MPFYEYRCRSCGHPFEEFIRSMSAPAKVKCPACGSKKTTRQFSVFSTAKTAEPTRHPNPKCATCSDSNCPYAP